MAKVIGFRGLDCAEREGHLATQADDNGRR